jgi:hypothetical protein
MPSFGIPNIPFAKPFLNLSDKSSENIVTVKKGNVRLNIKNTTNKARNFLLTNIFLGFASLTNRHAG